MRYIIATNYGKGFITHGDQESDLINFKGFPSDIWCLSGDPLGRITGWKNRVSGVEKTYTEAQDILNVWCEENHVFSGVTHYIELPQ